MVGGVSRDRGVGFRGRVDWSEVGEVNSMVVEVHVLDEEESNFASYGFGKGFESKLSQGWAKGNYVS